MVKKVVNAFTVGTDPEFMLMNKNSRLVSAVGIINGSKYKPINLDNGSVCSYDNVNLEFATKVAGSMKDFVSKVKSTLIEVKKLLPTDHSIQVKSSAFFPLAELQTEEAKAFGCDRDYNAWTLEVNPIPDLTSNERLRSCGGHLHLGQKHGYKFLKDPMGKVITVQTLDAVLGVISIVLDSSSDSRRRRELYGKAGCHRPTEYGVEYRVLSNFWLKNPMLVRLVYSLANDCFNLIENGFHDTLIEEIGQDKIIECINSGYIYQANQIIDNHLMAYISRQSKMLFKKVQSELYEIERKSIDWNWGIDATRG